MGMSVRLVTVLLVTTLGCGNTRAADDTRSHVLRARPTTQELKSRSVPKALSYVGTLIAPRDVTLSSTRGGRVDAYLCEVGQTVRRDEVLVKLGAAELSYASQAAVAGLAQARARLGSATDAASSSGALAAKAALQVATDSVQRAEQLYTSGTLSEQEMNRRRATQASAEAQYAGALAAAEAELVMVKQFEATSAQAGAALAEKTVRSPFQGVVLDRFVEVGQIAAPHEPLLRVIDPSELRVRFDVPQFDADKVVLGGAATVHIGERTVPAKVVLSTPGLVRQAHARAVEVSLSLPAELDAGVRAQLLPGAHFFVWLETGGKDDVVVVPVASTQSTAGLSRAWVLSDNRLSERLLSVLRFEGDQVLVRAGLGAGEQLVTTPSPDFRIGEEVAP